MKLKTINSVIAKKFDDWVDSVDDEGLRKDIQQGTVITGGCIASMLLQEPVNDYDMYFTTRGLAEKVARYYVRQFNNVHNVSVDEDVTEAVPTVVVDEETDRIRILIKSAGVASESSEATNYAYFEGQDPDNAGMYLDDIMGTAAEVEDAAKVIETQQRYRPVFLSENAITLSNDVQLVIRFVGDPAEIHNNYDYVHCTNYWTSWTRKVTTNKEALESLLARELRYVGSLYPICSIIRMRKFINRGWRITAGQILKMVFQASRLDLENIEVLHDQLVGVDVAYFHEVIRLLKEKQNETGERKVDQAYLMEVIDRMF